MQMRMEQQKHMYIRGQMPMQMPGAMPGMPPNMPGYPPQQLQQLQQLQQQQQQQPQMPYMAQPPSYGNLIHFYLFLSIILIDFCRCTEHRMPYAMPPYPGSNGGMQPGPAGPGGPNMMHGPGGPGGPGMMPGPGGAPGAYGSHPTYSYGALPPYSMYPSHQQQQQQQQVFIVSVFLL